MNAITVRLPNEIAPNADIRDLVNDWQAHLELLVTTGELSENSRDAYVRGWKRFKGWLDERDVNQVDSTVIRGWLGELRKAYQPKSINVWYAGVRSFFAWAVGARRLLINPTEGVKGANRKGAGGKAGLCDPMPDGLHCGPVG